MRPCVGGPQHVMSHTSSHNQDPKQYRQSPRPSFGVYILKELNTKRCSGSSLVLRLDVWCVLGGRVSQSQTLTRLHVAREWGTAQ